MSVDSTSCDVPAFQTSPDEIKKVVESYRSVAVVGLSRQEHRPSYQVVRYLKSRGYQMPPVHPIYKEISENPCYPSL